MALETTHVRIAGILHNLLSKKKSEGESRPELQDEDEGWPIFKREELKQVLSLGSFFPDIFSYLAGTAKIADKLHNDKVEVPSNEYIFKCLDGCIEATKKGEMESAQKSLMMLLGILSHIATDVTIHPMVYSLSGDHGGANEEEHEKIIYLHWLIEVLMEKLLIASDGEAEENIVDTDWQNDLFENIDILMNAIETTAEDFKEAFDHLLKYFQSFNDEMAYASHINLVRNGELSLAYLTPFEDHIKYLMEGVFPSDPIIFLDPITGEETETTLKKLVEDSVTLSIKMIEAALEYYQKGVEGEITDEDREKLKEVIPNNNLSTGRSDGSGTKNMKSRISDNGSTMGDHVKKLQEAKGDLDVSDLF
ncbi:MAG: zinc dependent phospholipase C family protein [Candidatus Pacebacteria bacterium]|jgi:hypothetical protein|nr:zinc dependent phospholipase C family protein [Candidatus Paceibacterota bacterium]MBT4652775.1 zinc dependent phospholipase C family protein [Candidatus Paceibacterota bacterium]MBT6755932.1 zinc dependent phospholipase C family protein [Candidatus Paceibacterota bacterium]MBT6921145.1 zinc dependent phospholipase C family protein [Candidatus Paceibacterota bacterium]